MSEKLKAVVTQANTVRLHRVFATKPEKVYRAFLEKDAMAKWLPPNGFTCKVQHMDAKVGGKFKMSFRNFTTGNEHSFGGEYLELVPNEVIRYTDSFDDPKSPRHHARDSYPQISLGRYRGQHRAGRHPSRDSARSLLSWLAAIPLSARAAR